MNAEARVSENILYEIWKCQKFKGKLETQDGKKIEILDSGNLNLDCGGPDFKNARIRIGNFVFVGDIEIDRNYSDWINHGHNINNKYNSVILHVYFKLNGGQSYVYSRSGRKVPSICIYEHVEIPDTNQFLIEDDDDKPFSAKKIKCTGINSNIDKQYKNKFLSNLGVDRFKKKTQKIFERLKELQYLNELRIKEPVIKYDLNEKFINREFKYSDFKNQKVWMQLFYELVFEALGYSKNKEQMIFLAQAANIDFLNRIENDGIIVEKLEAALFTISGLGQSTESVTEAASKNYIERNTLLWNSFRSFYDGEFLDEAIWHFFKMRPQNFPTLRLAGGARFLKQLLYDRLLNSLVKKITEIHNLTVLINSLRSSFIITSDGFWKNHFIFDQPSKTEIKYFVGSSRADDIIINVLLPFFAVYFEIFKQRHLVNKIQKLYGIYKQDSDNQLIFEISKTLNLKDEAKSSILSQGMIDLFRNYCSKNKCLECEIGKIAFN